MFIAFGAADALGEATADAAPVVAEAAGGVLLELLELQAASARAAVATAATAAQRPRDRGAGIEGTAKLLCAYSLGGGLADRPVGRVPARFTGFRRDQLNAIFRASRDQAERMLHKTSTLRRDASPARESPVTDYCPQHGH
jgi:hypothetical protein